MSTALQKVIAGDKPADSKKTGLLNEAVDKIKSLGGRITKASKMSEALADAVIAGPATCSCARSCGKASPFSYASWHATTAPSRVM